MAPPAVSGSSAPLVAVHAPEGIPAPPAEHAQRPRRAARRRPLLSKGSKNHASGQCRPCHAMRTAEGCLRGRACNYCHHDHDDGKLIEAALFSLTKLQKKAIQAPAFIQPSTYLMGCNDDDNESVVCLSDDSTEAESGSSANSAASPALPGTPLLELASLEPRYVSLPATA